MEASPATATTARPVRVTIVGGGCAGMTTAFELTRPEHHGRYEVTVYQTGWRLGGKGASGRGPAGRIEEHGLHLWMGFYDNAFGLMRDCYAELGRDPACCPIAAWRDAFAPAPFMGVTERLADDHWTPWLTAFPPTDGLPGDPYAERPRWTVVHYLLRAGGLLRTLFETFRDGLPEAGPSATPEREPRDGPQALLGRIAPLLRYGEMATLAALVEGVALLETMLGSLASYPDNVVLRFLDALGTNARAQLETRAEADPALGRLWTIADLTLATLRGVLRFGLVTDPRGFDAIDEYDCREWLVLNGASERSVESGYLRGLYDLGFSYEDADPARPRIAAGQALRSLLRAFFTYRGAFFWRLQSGMGDVVFAPLYEVLRRRGVRFRFFHRLENVGLAGLASEDGAFVGSLQFDVQAEIRDGRGYEPLVDVRGLPCWPSAPDWRQLADGDRLRREGRDFESFWDRRKVRTLTARVGDDFDIVVLAVGLGAVPHVCRELVTRDPRWRAMVDRVKTVATQAFQLWMRVDMTELGWARGGATVSGFVEPFDTWADQSHLIAREAWPQPPRAIAYFCNALPDPDEPDDGAEFLSRQRDRVRRNAVRFLREEIVHLWPGAAASAGDFRWDVLADPNEPGERLPAGESRFLSQFWTANVNPSDRYALSLPGSSAYRISPLDRTYDNFTVAGDWTDCGFNAGCVEAAVMSGRLAAHAIARRPRLEEIVGFDHP